MRNVVASMLHTIATGGTSREALEAGARAALERDDVRAVAVGAVLGEGAGKAAVALRDGDVGRAVEELGRGARVAGLVWGARR